MRRKHHYKRHAETPELDMTSFMNLLMVLLPFLLITAVFSQISIAELDLPSAQSGPPAAPTFRVEVVVRKAGIEIMDGAHVIAAIPKVGNSYNLPKLSEYLVAIKGEYPQKDDASVLLEPDIEYDHLIQIMDVVRSVETRDGGQTARASLFTAISIGDAP